MIFLFYFIFFIFFLLLLLSSQVSNSFKRIILLTNNDLPFNRNDPSSRNRSIQKGKDLKELDIQISLVAVGRKPKEDGSIEPFNPLLFFKEIIVFPEDESERLAQTFKSNLSDLMDNIYQKSMKKRSQGSIPLHIGQGNNRVSFGVKIYCMIKETKRESAVYLDSETNEELTTVTKWMDTSSGEVLTEKDLSKYFPYGGTKVPFATDEIKKLKDIGSAGLELMGFKPLTSLSITHQIRSSYFLFPDETQFSDSNRAFKALLYGMINLKQIAICRLIYRKGSIPRIVALLPQKDKVKNRIQYIYESILNGLCLQYYCLYFCSLFIDPLFFFYYLLLFIYFSSLFFSFLFLD
jgi:ATP-dependent DNA helicase 2 subunit 1